MTLFCGCRRLCTLVAMLFAFAVAAAPALDALICCDDTAVAAQAHAAEPAGDNPADHEPGQHAHGHCHFGAAFAPCGTMVAARMTAPDAHGLVLESGATLDLKSGLMRPPRA